MQILAHAAQVCTEASIIRFSWYCAHSMSTSANAAKQFPPLTTTIQFSFNWF